MNQPAFPTFNGMSDMQTQGMTLRDYFAAKAMQAMLYENSDYYQKYGFIDLADFSYICADAMLKARKR